MEHITHQKMKTGIEGLDAILGGGLHPERVYLVEGNPGTGKTTMAMQFLREGLKRGESVLYVTLSETAIELRDTLESHGWAPDPFPIFELNPASALLDPEQQQSLLYYSDLELGEATRQILDAVARDKPRRLVVDSLAEFRLLAQGSLRFRRQILSLKHYFAQNGVTVLLLDDLTGESTDRTMHSIVSGVIRFEELAPEYGAERRRMRVVKYRGASFKGGFHDVGIRKGGVEVYPRLVAAVRRRDFDRTQIVSGVAGLDSLMGGGLSRGTTTLMLGPAGAGKSIMALHYVGAALAAGEKAALYLFDEDVDLFMHRARGVGIDLVPHLAAGSVLVEQVDPAELPPGEFAHKVADAVEGHGASTIVIDSLNGYQLAMPHEKFLVLHMHELLSYLNRQGIVTILTVAQHGVLPSIAPVDLTYLSDTVVLLRFFEAAGRVRRAISTIKRRSGPHEDAIRELQITHAGIRVGAPLEQFRGVLGGTPQFIGRNDALFGREDAA